MAVAMRLKRMGTKKLACYRIVIMDSRCPRDGRTIEQIGHYDPKKETDNVRIDKERAEYWVSVGAKVSDF